jgi:hypothetical protein
VGKAQGAAGQTPPGVPSGPAKPPAPAGLEKAAKEGTLAANYPGAQAQGAAGSAAPGVVGAVGTGVGVAGAAGGAIGGAEDVKDQAQAAPGAAAVSAGTGIAAAAAPGAVGTAAGAAHESSKKISKAEDLPDDLKATGKSQAVGAAKGAAASTDAGGKVLEGAGAAKAAQHQEEMTEYDVKGAQKQVKKTGAAASDAADVAKKPGGDDGGNVGG